MSDTDTTAEARRESEQMNSEAFLTDLESRYVAMKEEKEALEATATEREALVKQLREKHQDLQSSVVAAETQLAEAQRESFTNKEQLQTLQAENQTKQERMDRMQAETDSLREEISRLTDTNKNLVEEVGKLEALSKITDSAAVPLQYELNRMHKEVDSLTSHTQWLEAELQERNSKISTMQQSHGSELREVRQKLVQAVGERDEASISLAKLERANQVLEKQLEKTSTELKDAKQEATTLMETTQAELAQERRLIELQKEQLVRLKDRYDDTVKRLETQQGLAREASLTTQEQVQNLQRELEESSQRVLTEQAKRYDEQIEALQSKLEEARRKCLELEEGFLATPVQRLLPSTAGPARLPTASEAGEEPMGLTELHERLYKVQDELLAEQTERKKLEIYLQKIQAEVAAKTPKMVRQRQDYERAVEEATESRERLKGALGELKSYREENKEITMEKAQLVKQNRELQQETHDLAKQVQALLVSRSGGDSLDDDIPTSVAEIQNQNQRLLQEHRQMESKIMELEERVRADPLLLRCQKAEKERDTLKANEKHQEALITGIVKQRDLYRAMLASQDSALVDKSTEEVIMAQSEKAKKLEELKLTLEAQLMKSQSDLTVAIREKEVLEERTARYEAHTNELTSAVDKLQAQLSSAKADVARSEAEASYHKDKCIRVEGTLALARDETKRIQDVKDGLQRINGEMQEALEKANAESFRYEQEVRQVERKLRLAETQVQTAKAAETRLSEEVTQLRNEMSRQGALLLSVQRIEASLSAKSEEQKDSLKDEVERLSQLLVSERSKHSRDNESLAGRIRELEIDLKEAESKKEDAVTEMAKARKDAATTASEMKDLTAKCARLEVELHSAKKKLGEEDAGSEGGEPEIELQTKVAALTADLETARAGLEAASKRVEDYQKLAKTNEDSLADLSNSMNHYKSEKEKELEKLKKEVETLKAESESKQEVIVDLTTDLSSLRGEQGKVVEELKAQIASLEGEAVSLRKDTESAVSRAAEMEAEIATYQAEAAAAQNNYERELNLHSTARTSLREAREECNSEIRLRKAAEEQLESLKAEHIEQRKIWDEQKAALDRTVNELEIALGESRSQNEILHSQLSTLGDQLERKQSERIDAAASAGDAPDDEEMNSLRKSVSDYREIVRYMKAQEKMWQDEADAARKSAEREKAVAAVTKRSLDEARSELKLLQEAQSAAAEKAPHASEGGAISSKLKAAEEQLTLLRESNKLLREDTEKLEKSVVSLKSELAVAKESAAPSEKKIRQLEVDKAALEADNASLLRDVEAWKGRLNNLVSKFHQIDPEDHNKVLKQVEDLTKECESLKAQKANAEREATSAKALLSRLNKELSQQKALVESQRKIMSKAASDSASRVSNEAAKERDQLKERIKKFESELASTKTELNGANERNDLLKTRLRQFQKMIVDLRKQKSELEQTVKAASTLVPAPAAPPATETAPSAPTPAAAPAPAIPKKQIVSKATEAAPPAAKQAPEQAPKQESKDETAASKESTVKDVPKGDFVESKAEKKVLPSVPSGGFTFGPGGALAPTEKTASTTTQPASTGVSEAATKVEDATKEPAKATRHQATTTKEAETSTPKAEKPDEKKEMTAEDKIRERLLQRKRKALAGLEKAKGAKAVKQAAKEPEKKPSSDEQPSSTSGEEQKSGEEEIEKSSTTAVVAPATSTLSVSATPFTPSDAREPTVEQEASAPEVEESALQAGEESAPAKDSAVKTDVQSTEPDQGPLTEGGEQTASADTTKAEGQSTQEKPAQPSGFGSFPFGSIGSGAPTFASTASGVAAPITFGKSSSIAPGASSTDAKQSGSELSFGGRSSFLNIKPPGSDSNAAPFTFGSSGKIKLPLPAPGAPSPFAPFGRSLSTTSSTSSFGGVGTTQAKPLFGSLTEAKRPAPSDDDLAAGEVKRQRSEDKEEGEEVDEADAIDENAKEDEEEQADDGEVE